MFYPIVVVVEADHIDTVDELAQEFGDRLAELFADDEFGLVLYEGSLDMPTVTILGEYK